MIAKPYDMTKPADRSRWYREMIGYLSLSGEDNFLVQGTDRPGRKYAFEAFQSIKGEFDTFQSEPSIRQDIIPMTKESLEAFKQQERQDERENVLEALKKDLQTRFISTSNQWSKGRNSGLFECCNIIDEELHKEIEERMKDLGAGCGDGK